jgi:hypothetical protein
VWLPARWCGEAMRSGHPNIPFAWAPWKNQRNIFREIMWSNFSSALTRFLICLINQGSM